MDVTLGQHAPFMGDDLAEPTDAGDAESLVWRQFVSQFTEYSHGARNNRVAYQSAKVVAIIVAASVTICAALSAPAWVTASLGGLLVVIEGLQQLFQWHANWISYRTLAEQLRQHGMAFAAGVEPYAGPDRRARLAALMRKVALTETSTWAGRMQESRSGDR